MARCVVVRKVTVTKGKVNLNFVWVIRSKCSASAGVELAVRLFVFGLICTKGLHAVRFPYPRPMMTHYSHYSIGVANVLRLSCLAKVVFLHCGEGMN